MRFTVSLAQDAAAMSQRPRRQLSLDGAAERARVHR
jgi:hypothetical protein